MKMANEVLVFNITGKPIKKYGSISEAARLEGICVGALSRHINEGTICPKTGHMYDYELRENKGKCL